MCIGNKTIFNTNNNNNKTHITKNRSCKKSQAFSAFTPKTFLFQLC